MKKQSAVDYIMWAQDRRHAVNQICQHNMQAGTIKLHLTGDTIYHQSSNGYAPVSIHYDSSMEMNALKAINMFTSTKPNSIYPSLTQMYTVRRADERVMLQNPENLNREVFLTQDLKTKLLKYKRESIDKYEKDPYWPSDQNYYNIVNKEYAEIQWLETFTGTQNDFFNSEYIKGFGLVFQYNPNPRPNQEEEAMLQELMKQEQSKITKALEDKNKIIADKDKALEDKDKQLLEEKDKNSDLTDKLASEKIVTKELIDKNTDLTNKLITKDEKIEVLKEKVEDLRNLNQELKDHKESLKESNKILIDDKKIWQDTEKLLKRYKELLVNEKKHYYELSMERASKISLLEQVHCNIPEHEYFIVKSTGSVGIQTDEI